MIFRRFFFEVKNLFLLLGIGYIFLTNASSSYTFLKNEIFVIYHNLGADYDQKMRLKITPKFYDFTKFVNRYAGENSLIMIPPQENPWQEEGNGAYIYYFLFPRKIVSGDFKTLSENKKITHVLIAWGNPNYKSESEEKFGWPKFKVKAKKIYYMNKNNPILSAEIVRGDYNPTDRRNDQAYGIIEL